MKKITFIVLLLSAGTIIYFFIKEQFRGIVLSHKENLILSVTYLLVGVCILVLFSLKSKEKQKQDNREK
ncbi:MAG: hypothetical protein ABI267_04825 [Ginsengibacter sp.]